jgi:hypothetical protein
MYNPIRAPVAGLAIGGRIVGYVCEVEVGTGEVAGVGAG